jgi:hypothetical protein
VDPEVARVFISYRRADGQYAVGWIEERLARLDEVTSVRTAFRDNTNLRIGDDLPDVLAAEVEQCDVLIAVIGPQWHGARSPGVARILDPNDWVAREIELALRFGKRIVPVLIGGMEPLDADTLPPGLQPLSELLALRFRDVEDLDRLDEEVREYLDDLDRERARLHGLDEPIVVPAFRRPWWVWCAAGAAGVVGVLVGYSIVALGRSDVNDTWRVLSAACVGFWASCCVVGVSYYRKVLSGVIQLRWRHVLRTASLALILVALTVTAFAPGGADQVWVTIAQAMLAVALMSPWIVMMLAVHWSTTTSDALRHRTLVVATHARDLAVATPVNVVALTLAVVTTATLVFDGESAGGAGDWLSMVFFGIFLTLIVLGALVYSSKALVHESDLIRAEIADLAPAYRHNVDAALIDARIDGRSPLVWVAFVPAAVAFVSAALGATW